jgi:hypothetical protein
MKRAYGVKHHCNKGKVLKIIGTIRHYRKTAALIASEQWRLFFIQGRFGKNLDVKHIDSAL